MINESIRSVMNDRYLLPTEFDENDIFTRCSKAIGQSKRKDGKKIEKEVYEAMKDGYIMPNSPALMNLGTDNQMLSACFVLPIEDSMEGIFETVKESALVHKRGGGVGSCFSDIRPCNEKVSSTNGKASGPISFLKVYDKATSVVKQAGKRRGANMATFKVSHPDIKDFIKCKDVDGDISNFNLSVMYTDKFMKAMLNDENWELVWGSKVYETLKARDLFGMAVHQAWKNGEPGALFYDTINNQEIPSNFAKEIINATNPCGEEPLPPYGSCNLSAINLGQLTTIDDKGNVVFDYEKLKYYVELNTIMLDVMLDLNEYPLDSIKKQSLKTRDIGGGVMGFADLLIKLKIVYGSKECIDLIDNIMSTYKKVAHDTSVSLGKGERKNRTLMTVAPTGTTAMFCNASSGIEPYFNFWYSRIIDDKKVLVFEGIIDHVLDKNQKEYIKECFENDKEIDISKINLPSYFVRSQDISWKAHVDVQAAFQRHVDSSISKTINLSNSASESEVQDAIIYAWKKGCKGVTVYRDGSRQEQVLSNIGDNSKNSGTNDYIVKGEIKLPEKIEGKTYKIKAGLGRDEPNHTFYIHVGLINNSPVQLFINYKRQADISSREKQLEAQTIEQLGMSISYQLRYGVPLTVIIKQLKEVPFTWMLSLHMQIANILSEYLNSDDICSECGSVIIYKNGCKECACGASNGCD